jgi:hypothetical protein
MAAEWLYVPGRWFEPDSPLTAMERHMLSTICRWVNTRSHLAWPSRKKIAARAAVSERTVQTAISHLVTHGALSKTQRTRPNGDRETNMYEVLGYDLPVAKGKQVPVPKTAPESERETVPRADCTSSAEDPASRSHGKLVPVAGERISRTAGETGSDRHGKQFPLNVLEVLNGELNGEVNTLTACAMNGDVDLFAQAWEAYPKRAGGNSRHDALRAWSARIRSGVDPAELIAGVRRYASFIRVKGDEGTPYVQQAATFFGPAQHWLERCDPPVERIGRLTRTHQRLAAWVEQPDNGQ